MNRSIDRRPQPERQISAAGFSMIEVALAVGVMGLCLLAVIALLPTGINAQRSARDQARGASALDMVACAAESLRFVSRSSGNATWAFPNYFSDSPDPSSNPSLVWVTQAPWNVTFFISEGGLIIPSNDTTTIRLQTLYAKIYPPQVEGQPVQIYAVLAWPYRPTDTASNTLVDFVGRQGLLETFVASTPNASF
jgi:hypothetical protein